LFEGCFLHDLQSYVPLADASITTWYCLRAGTIYVVSLEDDNIIFQNDSQVATLNKFARTTISVSAGDRIYALKPVSISGVYETVVPESFKGTRFVVCANRSDPQNIYIYAVESDAYVEIQQAGTVLASGTVTKGTVSTFSVNLSPPASCEIISDAPILVAANSNGGDNRMIPPASLEVYSIPSTNSDVGALEDNTTVRWFASDGTSGSFTIDRGTVKHNPKTAGSQYGSPAVRWVADKPIAVQNTADGDGVDATMGLPRELMGTYFVLPLNAEFIAIVAPYDNTHIEVYDTSGKVIYSTTITTSTGNLYPGYLKITTASWGGTGNIPYGYSVRANKPIWLIFEDKEFAADDETLLPGIDERKVRMNKYASIIEASRRSLSVIDNLLNISTTGYGNLGSLRIGGTEVITSGRVLQNVSADAGIITSGVFDVARIPDLDASKITSGVFDVARIPDLDASKITSGVFDIARIPDIPWTKIPDVSEDLLPDSDSTRNLGSSTLRWLNLHVNKVYMYNPPDWTGLV